MKMSRQIIILILISIIVVGGGFWLVQNGYFRQSPTTFERPFPAVNANGDPILGFFVGRTPCPDCQAMKVALVLYYNPETSSPTTYWLGLVFVGKGNDRTVYQGNWTIQHGIKEYPEAVVYQLDANTPEDLRSYWHVNKDILLPLDKDMNPKVGNSAWGFMLSRTEVPPERYTLSTNQ